jgi:exocyst complex component 2
VEQDPRLQNIRLLLVLSNLNHLSSVIIPGMITQLEGAFTVSLTEDRQVSVLLRVDIPILYVIL